MGNDRQKKARAKAGEISKFAGDAKLNHTAKSGRKPLCKIDRVLLHLRQNARGLNVVEAVTLGEHALRSTIAVLRAEGWQIEGTWERIAHRGASASRMIRYRLVGYQNPAEIAEAFAALLGKGGAK